MGDAQEASTKLNLPFFQLSFPLMSTPTGLETRKPDIPAPCSQIKSFSPFNQLLDKNE